MSLSTEPEAASGEPTRPAAAEYAGLPHLLAARYTVGDPIGGSVRAGWDTRLDRPVALKVAQTSPAHDAGAAALCFEARLLARFDHPAVLGIHDLLHVDGDARRPVLVLQWMDGGDLLGRLARAPLRLGAAVSMGRVLAEAVTVLHADGVVHRDIKPSNVLIDHGCASGAQVRLADFGVATLAGWSPFGHESVGTAAYLSPELRAGRPVGPAADVYGLGLTLLQALAGDRNLPGSGPRALLERLERTAGRDARLLLRVLAAATLDDEGHRPGAAALAGDLAEIEEALRLDGRAAPHEARRTTRSTANGAHDANRTHEGAER